MSFLDELYYGNINPNENRNRKKLPYEKALKTFSDIESKLTKELNGENLKLFNELVNASDEISAASGVENFKIGFRLGVKMMCDSLLFEENKVFKEIKKNGCFQQLRHLLPKSQPFQKAVSHNFLQEPSIPGSALR